MFEGNTQNYTQGMTSEVHGLFLGSFPKPYKALPNRLCYRV